MCKPKLMTLVATAALVAACSSSDSSETEDAQDGAVAADQTAEIVEDTVEDPAVEVMEDTSPGDQATQDDDQGEAGCPPDCPPISFRFSEPLRISDPTRTRDRTAPIGYDVAVSENTVHLVWQSIATDARSELHYMRSLDQGETWEDRLALVEGAWRANMQVIRAEGQNVYVSWKDERDSDTGEIYFKASRDGGATWGDDVAVTDNEIRIAVPEIEIGWGKLFLVWEDYFTGTPDLEQSNVEFTASTDDGLTWRAPIDITENLDGCPIVRRGSGDNLHLIYCTLRYQGETRGYNWEVLYRNSANRGEDWGAEQRLTDDEDGDSRYPVIAVVGSNLHVVWWDDRDDHTHPHAGWPEIEVPVDYNYEIYYLRSLDAGQSWDPYVRLTEADGVAAYPSLAAAGPTVLAAWQDHRGDDYDVYLKWSTDNGTTWSEDVAVTDDDFDSTNVSMDMDRDGNVHLIYMNGTNQASTVHYVRGERQ